MTDKTYYKQVKFNTDYTIPMDYKAGDIVLVTEEQAAHLLKHGVVSAFNETPSAEHYTHPDNVHRAVYGLYRPSTKKELQSVHSSDFTLEEFELIKPRSLNRWFIFIAFVIAAVVACYLSEQLVYHVAMGSTQKDFAQITEMQYYNLCELGKCQ